MVQSLAPRVADGVDLLELDRDKAGDTRLVTVTHDAVPLHDVGAVGEPAPRALEGSDHRVVVGVEDSHELAGHDGQCRVDVVGLRSAVGDPQQFEARFLGREGPELVLHRKAHGRVVGEDHLKAAVVLLRQHGAQGLQNRGGLVRQIGGNDGRRWRRGRCTGRWQGILPQGAETLSELSCRHEQQYGHQTEIHEARDIHAREVCEHHDR